MQSDRTEMLYWLQQERRSVRLEAAINHSSASSNTALQQPKLAPVSKVDVQPLSGNLVSRLL